MGNLWEIQTVMEVLTNKVTFNHQQLMSIEWEVVENNILRLLLYCYLYLGCENGILFLSSYWKYKKSDNIGIGFKLLLFAAFH